MIWWRVFLQTYADVWRNAPSLALGALPVLAVFAVMAWLPLNESPLAGLAFFLLALTALFFVCMLLVSFQRRLLLPETAGESLLRLRPNRRDWKAFGAALAIWIVAGLLASFVDGLLLNAAEEIAYAVSGLYFLVSLYLMPRVLMVFPVIVTDTAEPAKAAWRLSRGVQLQFWPAGFSMLVLIMVLIAGTSAAVHSLPEEAPELLFAVAFGASLVIPMFVGAVLLTSLLAQIHRHRSLPNSAQPDAASPPAQPLR
jgi:hypothetical protein